MKNVSLEEFKKMQKEQSRPLANEDLKKSHVEIATNNIPYYVQDAKGKGKLLGDTNLAESNAFTYDVEFAVYKNDIHLFPYEAKSVRELEGSEFMFITVEFKNVKLTPKRKTAIQLDALSLMPFIYKVRKNEEIQEFTDEERGIFLMENYHEFDETFYSFVNSYLNIDKEWREYVTPASIFETGTAIFNNHPNLMNDIDASFD